MRTVSFTPLFTYKLQENFTAIFWADAFTPLEAYVFYQGGGTFTPLPGYVFCTGSYFYPVSVELGAEGHRGHTAFTPPSVSLRSKAMPQQEFSTSEVVRILGCHEDTLYRWLREGRLPDPPRISVGKISVRIWRVADVERAKTLREQGLRLRPRKPC